MSAQHTNKPKLQSTSPTHRFKQLHGISTCINERVDSNSCGLGGGGIGNERIYHTAMYMYWSTNCSNQCTIVYSQFMCMFEKVTVVVKRQRCHQNNIQYDKLLTLTCARVNYYLSITNSFNKMRFSVIDPNIQLKIVNLHL